MKEKEAEQQREDKEAGSFIEKTNSNDGVCITEQEQIKKYWKMGCQWLIVYLQSYRAAHIMMQQELVSVVPVKWKLFILYF